MTTRRQWLGLIGLAPLASLAQLSRRRAVVGFLGFGPAAQYADSLDVMETRLNLTIEARFADSAYERLDALVAELMQAKADVVVAAGMPAALAAVRGVGPVPMVVTLLADPMDIEVLGRLAMQAGNVTGLVVSLTDLNARRLELLKEALPATARAAVLINPANPTMAPLMREAEPVAQRLGIALHAFALQRAGQLAPTMDAVARDSDSLLIMEDAFLETQASEIAGLAAARRLPALGFHTRFAEAGGLMAYGVDQRALFRSCADYVQRILQGARAAELRIQRAATLELAVNLATARALGIALPKSVSSRANRLID